MNKEEAQKALNQRFETINKNTDSTIHGNMIAQARDAYAKRWGTGMSAAKEAILKQSMTQFTNVLSKRGMTRQQIASAVADVANVENPISMLYNLMSILVPNFAYTEVIGVQPIPTKESPIFFPQITANESRNGVTKGEKLLGSTYWNKKSTYSTNKNTADLTLGSGNTVLTATVSGRKLLPNTIIVNVTGANVGSIVLVDDGNGKLVATAGSDVISSGKIVANSSTVNYETGVVTVTLAAADDTATGKFEYRYDWGNGGAVNDSTIQNPAQIVFEWATKMITANPYRLRSTYDLDNFYAAKQVLGGYDIDSVLNTSLGGLINKEISCNVFDEMAAHTDATYSWDKDCPNGLDPLQYAMTFVSKFVEASNGIRANIARCGGNYIIAGTNFMNVLESLPANFFNNGNVWTPEKFADEPIGPYVAGNLLGKFKVLKNQEYDDNMAVMGYKKDDTDASYMGGVYIGLYSTNPIAMDDLKVIQGCGTQMGTTKVFDNSLVKLIVE